MANAGFLKLTSEQMLRSKVQVVQVVLNVFNCIKN
jgi:hypothetical protein